MKTLQVLFVLLLWVAIFSLPSCSNHGHRSKYLTTAPDTTVTDTCQSDD